MYFQIHQFTDFYPSRVAASDSPRRASKPIHPFTHSPNSGVTLVELLIVIAIIGIIAALVTIDTGWFQREARVTEYRDRLLADIEDIKLKSLAKTPHGIFVAGGNSTGYTVVQLRDFRCSTTTTTACLEDSHCPGGETCSVTGNFKRDSLEATSTLSTVTFNTGYRISFSDSDGELWFDRKGISRTDTWTVTNNTFWVWYDSNGNGTQDTGESAKQIGVDNGGRIQYE